MKYYIHASHTFWPYCSHTSCKIKLCIESHSTGICELTTPMILYEIQKGLRLGGSRGSPPAGFEGAAPLAVSSRDASGFMCHSLPRWRKPTGRGKSFHDLSITITETRSEINPKPPPYKRSYHLYQSTYHHMQTSQTYNFTTSALIPLKDYG